MSRHWSEYKYLDTESLWGFIDEQSNRLNMLGQNDSVESSELCKLLLLGRREMLDALCDYLSDNQTRLQDVMIIHNILTEEEVNKLIEEEYGI